MLNSITRSLSKKPSLAPHQFFHKRWARTLMPGNEESSYEGLSMPQAGAAEHRFELVFHSQI
jgi:hypothetical protein